MRSTRHLPGSRYNVRRHGGMTLIEVLVTLVIISVGLLGVAALQLTTVRSNSDAFVRSQAAMLAGDMLDRMRSNRNTAAGEGPGRYVIEMDDDPDLATPAGRDTANWRRVLDDQLPNGAGSIEYDAVSRLVTITIQWGERSEREADRLLEFKTSSTI